MKSCISFIFYIKPQPSGYSDTYVQVVYLLFSTSNHNFSSCCFHSFLVVYLLFSTSNHNFKDDRKEKYKLYIFYFLHQTTTIHSFVPRGICCISFIFYIKPQLQNEREILRKRCISFIFYIKPQHKWHLMKPKQSCISFIFYIKPQLLLNWPHSFQVVYLLFSTSNHNLLV